MAHVHIEPEVRYFDIVVDGVDQDDQEGVQEHLLSREDVKALGIRKVEYPQADQFTIRVFLEADTNAEGVRSYLYNKLATWFSEATEFEAVRSRAQDRLIIILEKQLEPVAA